MAQRSIRSDMSVDDARALLGIRPDASWDEIRHTYRAAMRRTHPDLAPAGDATVRAARINAAFEVLRDATNGGRRPAAVGTQPSRAPVSKRASVTPTLEVPAGDVFVSVLEAAHDIGDVSYIDPEAGLIQLLLDGGGPAGSQLLIVIDEKAVPATASFTLDSMDEAHAPDIAEVVKRLGDVLNATR